ncbi:unnamed protein product [Leptosia nina]|uniref:Uncharacterized protein n=1 Tax=Leptosia nina TaxID=320188 RepID=A0AAV1IYG4_9NEOP
MGSQEDPCCSKEVDNGEDPDDKKDEESREEDQRTSGTYISNYSADSRLHMASTGIEKPKLGLGKPEGKFDDKKRRKRRIGRVEKQRKPSTRRQLNRRAPKRKPRARGNKKRDLSISTMYSRLSSSGILTPACERCGHRCCRRR